MSFIRIYFRFGVFVAFFFVRGQQRYGANVEIRASATRHAITLFRRQEVKRRHEHRR